MKKINAHQIQKENFRGKKATVFFALLENIQEINSAKWQNGDHISLENTQRMAMRQYRSGQIAICARIDQATRQIQPYSSFHCAWDYQIDQTEWKNCSGGLLQIALWFDEMQNKVADVYQPQKSGKLHFPEDLLFPVRHVTLTTAKAYVLEDIERRVAKKEIYPPNMTESELIAKSIRLVSSWLRSLSIPFGDWCFYPMAEACGIE